MAVLAVNRVRSRGGGDGGALGVGQGSKPQESQANLVEFMTAEHYVGMYETLVGWGGVVDPLKGSWWSCASSPRWARPSCWSALLVRGASHRRPPGPQTARHTGQTAPLLRAPPES